MTDAPPEPDKAEGAPHPREARALVGQAAAEGEFLSAFASGKLHHAWLLTGPHGVGKATLAWRIARFLLVQPLAAGDGLFGAPDVPDTLEIADDDPVQHRTTALSEPRLFLMRRSPHPDTGRMRDAITIDAARALKRFLALSSSDAGRRVVLIDAADEMNTATSNAILKLLEEPPANTVLLLVCHAPTRLLPTIRSRARVLRCTPLGADDMATALGNAGLAVEDPLALAQLSAGSAGDAARLLHYDGPEIYARLVALMQDAPRIDRPDLLSLASSAANAERLDVIARLIDLMLSRLARQGAGHPPLAEAARGEAALLARLAPDTAAARLWSDRHQSLGARMAHGRLVNIDPSSLILDTVLAMNDTAGRILR